MAVVLVLTSAVFCAVIGAHDFCTGYLFSFFSFFNSRIVFGALPYTLLV